MLSHVRDLKRKAWRVIDQLAVNSKQVESAQVAFEAFVAPKCHQKNKKPDAWKKSKLQLNQAWADFVANRVKEGSKATKSKSVTNDASENSEDESNSE